MHSIISPPALTPGNTVTTLTKTKKIFQRLGSAVLIVASMLSITTTTAYAQPALSPEVQRGLTWLQSQIQTSGEVITPPAPQIVIARTSQTQSETGLTLKSLTATVPVNVDTVLQSVTESTTETLARQVQGAVASGANPDATLVKLAALQNADGGYGGAAGYASNPLDTAYALLALRAKPSQYTTAAQNALAYLATATPTSTTNLPTLGVNQQSHVFAAAYIMLAANEWRTQFSVGAVTSTAKTWLLSQRSPQNVYESSQLNAVALLALLGDTRDATLLDPLVNGLKSAQQSNGSWSGDAYVTALALRALQRSTQPIPVATTGGVQGTVTDEATGSPLVDVSILVVQDTTQSTTTPASGAFSLSNLAAGNYTLRLSKLGYQPRDVTFVIVAAQTTSLGSIALRSAPLTASLSGVVKNSAGTALRDVLISVGTSSALTDASGAYLITGLSPGAATVTAALSGYQTATGSVTFVAGTNFVFSPTLYSTGQPPATTTFKGIVVDETTGNPITGASVVVGSVTKTTAADGAFTFTDLNTGTFTAVVSATGYTNTNLSGTLGLGVNDAGKIKLSKQPNASTTATLSGVVTGSSNQALSGVVVRVGTLTATTIGDGSYRITGIPAGTATITATLSGYQTATVSAAFLAGGSYVFSPTMYPNGVTPLGTSLKGSIVDSVTKSPIQGAQIVLGTVTNTTPAAGTFEFTNLNTGAFSVAVSATGYASANFSGTLVAGLNDVGKIELVKQAATSTLSGVIKDSATKAPIVGAVVAVQGLATTATSGTDGTYSITGITNNAPKLTVTATGYITRQLSVTLPQAGVSTLDIELTKPGSTKISFEFVRTLKPTYNPDEKVGLEIEVKNIDAAAVPLLIEADVFDAQSRVVYTFLANSQTGWAGVRQPNQPVTIPAAGTLDVPMDWFMLRQAAGTYQVLARGIDTNGLVVVEGRTTFTVTSAAILRGGVTPNPPLAQFGTNQPVALSANLLNAGNQAIPPGNLDVRIVLENPDTQTSTIPLASGKLFTSGIPLSQSKKLVVDAAGNLYTINAADYKILKIDPAGVISVVVTLPNTYGTAVDLALGANGDIWVITNNGPRLLRVDAAGAVTASTYTSLSTASAIDVAANGDIVLTGTYYSSVAPDYRVEQRLIRRTTAGVEIVLWANGLSGPVAFVKDDAGNLVVTNYSDNSLTKISVVTGEITPFATTGFNRPQGITRDTAGNYFVANTGSNTVSKVTAAGAVSVYATGFKSPVDLRFDASGNLFVSNQDDNSIAKVLPNGTVEIFARGIANGPRGMKYDRAGNLWIANNDGTLRKKDTADSVSIIATNLSSPVGVAINSSDDVFVANYGAGTIDKFVAGVKTQFATALASPWGVAVDGAGNIWATEYGSSRIKKIDAAGAIQQTIDSAVLNPDLMRAGVAGELYIRNSGYISVVESGASRVFFRNPSISIGNFAVDPVAGGLVMLSGYDIYRITPAGVATKLTSSSLPFYPYDIGVDASGAILLADYSGKTVQKFSSGVVTPLAVLPENFQTLLVDLSGRLTVKSASNKLYRVESDGTSALILTPTITDYIYNYAIDANGKLLAITYPKLYEVDRATGASTLVSASSFYSASSLTRDSSGKIYATYAGDQDLVTYDPTGAKLSVLSGFSNPKDIVWTGTDFRFTDGGNRLYALSTAGSLEKISTNYTADFLAYQNGTLYSPYSNRIYRWDGTAPEIYTTVADAYFNGGIAANATSLAVADTYGSRIVVLDSSKAVVADYSGLIRPQGLAFDAAGKLYVASNGSGAIARIERTGKASTLFAKISDPRFLAFDATGKLWVTNSAGSTQIDSAGLLSSPVAQSGGIWGIGFDGASVFAVDYSQSILRKFDGDIWKPFATGLSTPVGVRVAANDDIYVANQSNGTVVRYANGKLDTVASGLASPSAIDLASDGKLYVAGAAGNLTTVSTTGEQGELRISRLVDNQALNGVAVAPNGKIYVDAYGYNYTLAKYVDNVYEVSVTQSVTPPAAGTVVYTGTAPISALPADGSYAALDLGTWLPPYGGDFRVEVSRAGVAGGATNFIHVGSFANSELAASKSELPPGDQTLSMCMKLDGADFTSVSRVETSQVRPVASFGFPKGIAGDKSGNVYYTDGVSLFQVAQGQTTGTAIAGAMNLSFGLAADNDENFYVASKNATSSNFELIKITKAGIKTVVADLGVTQANGVQVDSKGDVLVGSPNRLIKVTKAGVVSTLTTSGLPSPRGIAIDGRDNVYVQNESNFVSLIKPDGSVYDIYSKSDGVNDPIFEGDGYPNIAADCADNFYIATSQWSKIKQSGEEHTLAQVIARTGKVALLFDALNINPVLSDIDYLAFDRLGNRILMWNHSDSKVWSVPVTCGAIGVQAHLVAQPGQKLSGISKAPAAIIPLADGRTEYVWSLKDVTAQGEQVCFDTTQSSLKLGELRKTLDSGYVTFQNSFSPNDVKVPLDIPFVRASNLVTLAVATDKGDYAANTTADVTTTLTNAYTRVIGGTLTVQVFDDKNVLVGSVTQQGVSIPASGNLPVAAPFPIGRIVPAKYTVKAVLVDNGIEQARAQSDFNVLPDNVSASAISSVSTDRRTYNPSDRVVISSRANSQSANVILENLTLMVRVYDTTNTLMLTYGHAIAQLLPGAQRDFALPQALRNVPSGVYAVKQELQDAQGRVLDTRQTAYNVGTTADTGFGLTGAIAATPKQIRTGETLTLASSATNAGNAALTNLPLKVVIVDPIQGTVVAEYSTTASSIAASGTFTLPSSTWIGAGRTNATYLAVLTATIGSGASANQQTLATDTFQLLPQIATTITAVAGTPQAATITKPYASVLEVIVRDTVGAPFVNALVTFTAPASGATVTFTAGNTATTDSLGRASVSVVANGTAGAFNVVATTPNATPSPNANSATFALTNLPPQAAKIAVFSGTPQVALVTKPYGQTLKAVVTNNIDLPVVGASVKFAAPTGANAASATFPSGDTATTDSAGVATVAVTANAVTGKFQVNATTTGVPGAALFDLTNRPASAAVLELVSGTPQSTTVTQSYAQPLVARVKDELGAPIGGVLITFAAPTVSGASGASVTFPAGNTAVTNGQGLASVSVTANATAGAFNVTATAADVTGSIAYALTNKAVVAASITVTSGTPQSTPINTNYTQPLVATVKDNLGNAMSGIVVTFTVPVVGTNGATATFPAGNTAVTGSNGQASVSARANGSIGAFTVSATAPNVTGSADFPLTIEAGACGRAQSVAFAAVNDAPKQTLLRSNTVTVAGLGAGCNAPASIAGGAYTISRAGTTITTKASVGFSTAAQTVQDGDLITLEQTTSDKAGATTSATLTLDGVAYAWRATTALDGQPITPREIPMLPDEEPMRSLVLALLALMIAGLGRRGLSRRKAGQV
jgi:sugar lactone lactonase YvrE